MDSDSDSAARQRFHAFKMGGGAPPNSLHAFSTHSHRRSRSRNSSVSLSLSLSAPALSPPPTDSPSLAPSSKRSASHHHRRSSVSTRHESAELMGVSLPELPPALSDDNINLGDKDSIRRRALRALEGKPDIAFSKVEIPDISPDISKPTEFPSKPSFPPGSALNGASTFAAKRDSFGKMFGSTSVSKDQLGTLLEEEEEEEEEEKIEKETNIQCRVDQSGERNNPPRTLPTKTRHRPASLNLRPLSLVQGTVVSSLAGSLPTPSPTPGPLSSSRKSLISPALDDVIPIVSVPPSNASISVHQAPSSRSFSYSLHESTSASCDFGPKRRSSISYKRSVDSIPRDIFPPPTPDMSPADRRFSFTSDQETLIEQPLSVADQHFLFRSHHVLLSRITELERTLRHRSPRHHSYASDASTAFSEPSNEMLHLISDLKAERDELKRDVDGWRQRVADADKQATMLAKRIESERRDAWVARSCLGLLEAEKSGLEKSVETKTAALSQSLAENAILMRERDELKDKIMKLNARLEDADAAVDECTRLRGALEQERRRRKEFEKTLDDAGLLNTPKLAHVNGSWRRPPFSAKPAGTRPRGLGFQSIDSESSTTDVESLDDSFTKAEFTLDAVTEEDAEFSDGENGLAGYEDEEDSDLSFSSPDGSCIGLADEPEIKSEVPIGEIPDGSFSLPSKPTHEPRSSLSKTWTFPRGKNVVAAKQDDEIDRFFGCLEDGDRSPPLAEETNQSMFSSAFGSIPDDNELPPFVLPVDVGVVIDSSSSKSLVVVAEEDEGDDELVGEQVEGGIRFTFNAPPVICVTPPPDACKTPPPEIRITPPEMSPTPALRSFVDVSEPVEDVQDESALTLVFPAECQTSLRSSPSTSSVPFRPSTRNGSPPSSIPRAVSLRSMSPKTPSVMFTPSKNASGRSAILSAYSSKKTSSSIPQLVTPPKTAQNSVDTSKQGQTDSPNANDSMSALRYLCSSESGSATTEVNNSKNPDPSSSGACEYSHAQDTSSLSSIMSNPLAARSPFQKLSHLISFTWPPGATTVASYIVPNSSVSPSVEAADTAVSPSGGGSATRRTQRRFVSKARQLEKLKNRFSFEKRNGIAPCCTVSACKGCSAGDVYL